MFRTMCPSCNNVYKITKENIYQIFPCRKCKFVFLVERLKDTNPLPVFIQIGINKGKITEKNVAQIVDFYKKNLNEKQLIEYLLKNNIVNEKELSLLIRESGSLDDKMFIMTVLNEGLVSKDDITASLKLQKRSKKQGKRIAVRDIMINLGFISRKQMERMKSIQVNERARLYETEVKKEIEKRKPTEDNSLDLCNFAISHNFITKEQLIEASEFKKDEKFQKLNTMQILMETDKITPQKVLLLLTLKEYGKVRTNENLFGQIGMKNGILTKEMVGEALKTQREFFKKSFKIKKLGEILKEQAKISDEDISQILLLQNTSDEYVVKGSDNSSETYNYEEDLSLCEFGVTHNFIERKDLDEAVNLRKLSPNPQPLIQILISKNVITAKQALLLRTVKEFGIIRDKDQLFGQIAIKKGLLKTEEVKSALKNQLDLYKNRNKIKRIGDLLVESGSLSLENRDKILTVQEEQDKVIIEAIEKRKVREEKEPDPKEVILSEKTSPVIEQSEFTRKVSKLTIDISEDNLVAFIILPDDRTGISIEDINELLAINGVVHGITDSEVMSNAISSNALKINKFVAARGTAAFDGTNGKVTYSFDTDYLTAGEIKEDGSIDFKERGETPFVKKDEIIAVKTPPIFGKHGIDIFGNQILTKDVNDPNLKAGDGAYLSMDGLTVRASIDGRPDLSVGGVISVFDELYIPGNVDFKSGNVDFKGNIRVKGTILEGFSVQGVNITVNEIEGGSAKAENDLNVSAGIIEAEVFAGGATQAMFVRNSKVFSFGDVIITREIIDSEIITSGQCITERGHIINSKVYARKGVTALHIGNDMTEPCILGVGMDTHIKMVIDLYKLEISAIEEKINSQNRIIDSLNSIINESLDKLVSSTTKSEKINNEIDELKTLALNEKGDYTSKIESLEKSLEKMEEKAQKEIKTQEECDLKINMAKKILDSNTKKLDIVKANRDGAVEWSKQHEYMPNVKVLGSICRKTVIRTKNTRHQMNETIHVCSIKEVNNTFRLTEKERAEKGIPDYEIVVISDQKKYSK